MCAVFLPMFCLGVLCFDVSLLRCINQWCLKCIAIYIGLRLISLIIFKRINLTGLIRNSNPVICGEESFIY